MRSGRLGRNGFVVIGEGSKCPLVVCQRGSLRYVRQRRIVITWILNRSAGVILIGGGLGCLLAVQFTLFASSFCRIAGLGAVDWPLILILRLCLLWVRALHTLHTDRGVTKVNAFLG